MKNINVAIDDDVHARLREYAWINRMTLANALRYTLDHCLPPLQSKAKLENDNHAGEPTQVKP